MNIIENTDKEATHKCAYQEIGSWRGRFDIPTVGITCEHDLEVGGQQQDAKVRNFDDQTLMSLYRNYQVRSLCSLCGRKFAPCE